MKTKTQNRFMLLAVKQIKEDWKRQLILTGVLVGILSITFWGISAINGEFQHMSSSANTTTYSVTVNTVSFDTMSTAMIGMVLIGAILSIFYTVFYYQTAHSMPFMANKQKHIQHILLPASKGEKFWVALVLPFFISTVQMLIALPIAELIHYVLSGNSSIMIIANIPSNFFDLLDEFQRKYLENVYNGLGNYFVYSFILNAIFYHAFALFSASIFRKHPFLLSLVASMILNGIVSIIMFIPVPSYFDASLQFAANDYILDTQWFSFGLTAILTVACYIIAYRRMGKAQI